MFHGYWVGLCKTKRVLCCLRSKKKKNQRVVCLIPANVRILAEHLHFSYIHTVSYKKTRRWVTADLDLFWTNRLKAIFSCNGKATGCVQGDITYFYFRKNSSTVPHEQFLKENREAHIQKIPWHIGKLYSESFSLSKW